MPHWMTHPQHGVMPVYSQSEVAQGQSLGWTLLNSGESPNLPPKVKPSAEKLEQERLDRAGMCSVHSPEPSEAHSEPVEAISQPDAPESTSEPAEAPAKRKPGRPRKVK